MRVENVKRIRLVDVTFDQPLTLIGGDNGQGKSSFLDSYMFCLGGRASIQMDPIHHGAQSGSITCDFGDGENVRMTVKRTIQRVGDSDWTTEIDVEVPGHVTPSKVQEFLGKLAGEMSFDPMAFDKLKSPDQFDILQKFVSGFDFKANAKSAKEAYDARTIVNRDQKREQSSADSITTGPIPPCQPIDEAALVTALREAGEKNTDRATRAANREKATLKISELRKSAADLPNKIQLALELVTATHFTIESAARARIFDLRMQIKALEERIVGEEKILEQAAVDLANTKVASQIDLEGIAQRQSAEADELESRLAAAGPLPEAIDATAISGQLDQARAANAKHSAWKQSRDQKLAYQAEADRLAAESDDLTKLITDLDTAKLKAIESAALPVTGLGFGDSYVTLDKVPWEQASTAQRIDASTAIAMALNPKLKVILIHNGSNLGSKMKERIRQRAIEKGYRVLMEVVDDTGGTHVLLEDGLVKAHES
jgi:DNA repair exonuclease SbcCD ATPase subunit